MLRKQQPHGSVDRCTAHTAGVRDGTTHDMHHSPALPIMLLRVVGQNVKTGLHQQRRFRLPADRVGEDRGDGRHRGSHFFCTPQRQPHRSQVSSQLSKGFGKPFLLMQRLDSARQCRSRRCAVVAVHRQHRRRGSKRGGCGSHEQQVRQCISIAFLPTARKKWKHHDACKRS